MKLLLIRHIVGEYLYNILPGLFSKWLSSDLVNYLSLYIELTHIEKKRLQKSVLQNLEINLQDLIGEVTHKFLSPHRVKSLLIEKY